MRFVQFISLILILVSVQSARVCVTAFDGSGQGGCKVAFSAEVKSLADGSQIKNLKVSPGMKFCLESGETDVVMDWECFESNMEVVENGQPICAAVAKRRSLFGWRSAARRFVRRHSHRILGTALWAWNRFGRRLLDESCKQKESVACYAASQAYSDALNYDSAETPDLPALLCACPDYKGYLDTLECNKN